MKSMTGFGKAAVSGTDVAWSVECHSLNRKGLEVVWQGPRECQSWEAEVRAEVARFVARGRVAVVLQQVVPEGYGAATLDPVRCEAAWRELEALRARLHIAAPVTLDQLLRHPALQTSAPPAPADRAAVLAAIGEAMTALVRVREEEGAALAAVLTKYGEEGRTLTAEIAALAPGVPVRHRELLLERLEQARLRTLPDEARLAAEVALFAERCDISEELARLDSHWAQFGELLRREGPVGRELEFLVQELFREANTLGAKSGLVEISRHAVALKSLLDKIREQLGNVE
jgi:uncharacterized protein (TIGR00255 family)